LEGGGEGESENWEGEWMGRGKNNEQEGGRVMNRNAPVVYWNQFRVIFPFPQILSFKLFPSNSLSFSNSHTLSFLQILSLKFSFLQTLLQTPSQQYNFYFSPPQMLYIIGTGLNDYKDLSIRSLEILKEADFVYLEGYTCIQLLDKNEIDKNEIDKNEIDKEELPDKKDSSMLEKGTVDNSISPSNRQSRENNTQSKEKKGPMENSSLLGSFKELEALIGKSIKVADRKLIEETTEIFDRSLEMKGDIVERDIVEGESDRESDMKVSLTADPREVSLTADPKEQETNKITQTNKTVNKINQTNKIDETNKINQINKTVNNKTKSVVLLVVGTPLFATTHIDIYLNAKKNQIPVEIIHNVSILNVKGCYGLYSYNFGRTISIPYFTATWKPLSFYDNLFINWSNKMHTLCLLDIKTDENRFMNVQEALNNLMFAEGEKRMGMINEEMEVIAVCRFATREEKMKFGKIKELMKIDFGGPLHSLIVPGGLSILEREFLSETVKEM